jgi:hypothetical protein
VPEARYVIAAGDFGGFVVFVDASGNVSVENGISATGGNQIVTFNTTTISIDPGDFQNQVDGGAAVNWIIPRVADVFGPADLFVLPGTSYAMRVGYYGQFPFSIDQNGFITLETSISATAAGNTMHFNTETVLIDPNTYQGVWAVSRVIGYVTGAQALNLVPGFGYRITGLSQADFFDVDNPCAVNPETLVLGGETFTLSCGAPDSDNDGVPDDADICPNGDDNIDGDGDLVPDDCDTCPLDADNDADGDGVCGDVDSCPGADDGIDTDLDGFPDGDPNALPPVFCDVCPLDPFNDADDDGVCGNLDNCPIVANSNQANNDGDQVGDACDADDDNDGVCDDGQDNFDCVAGPDNCPLDANNDQADFDNDSIGDTCDIDDDADGVVDAADSCPTTAFGASVDGEGCAIADLCPCENSWKNHGSYVRCVAHAANDFFGLGLITETEHGDILSVAGQSDCGNKK